MIKTSPKWTKHEEVILVHARKNGKTWEEISDLVGNKSKKTIETKIYELTDGYVDGWTEKQKQRINEGLESGKSIADIAKAFGGTYTSHQVRIKAEDLGWNVDEIESASIVKTIPENSRSLDVLRKRVLEQTCDMLGHYPRNTLDDMVVHLTFAANESGRNENLVAEITGFPLSFVEAVFRKLDENKIWEKSKPTSIAAGMDAHSFIVMADICENNIHLLV